MTSSKPYLLRGLYEWILDNDLTPHVIVDVNAAEVDVPPQAIQDGRLVLNISPQATRDLKLDNGFVSFQARFAGSSRDIWLPMNAILAIYARENGQGMMFADAGDDDPEPPASDEPPSRPSGPRLRVIK
ncbi:ClpXP protease specificity-enhancing factor [Marinihelvus fidelis]|uniref:ClpXP protease specificity-enhancing factor n=1 Tax=Marinihelvus fidelis TaxID=2613842 RepID=A0A5N0TF33_9GAMM|nr:ClpXP protease specificity-enhancing factor [Marinihelvus fidelis]KAA9132486.1 ClpXP protease specificity-enhancing factor [Marinihelvus fidelis]